MAHPLVEDLERRRKLARVTSEELAERAGSDAATLSRWRTSATAPNTATLDRFNEALDALIEERKLALEQATR